MIYIFSAFIYLLVIPSDAYAYLDPGTGSYIFQVVVATLLASGYFFREKIGMVINSLKNFFTSFLGKNNGKKTKK